MRIAALIGSVVLTGALAACAHHPSTSASAPQGYSPTGAAASCPLAQLRNVNATVTDIDKGSAITFTAPKSQVKQLRDNIHAMADAQDKMGDAFAYCPCSEIGGVAAGAAEAQGQSMGQTSGQAINKVAASSSVEEIPTGAILKLVAKNDHDVQTLRSQIRNDVDALNRSCLNIPSQNPYGAPGGQ